VRPFASVIAINRLEHFGHRRSSMVASSLQGNNLESSWFQQSKHPVSKTP
jgi:hypothetical protein